MSHVDILSPSAPGPQWQPWSSDALERRRHKALLIGCKWALHGPMCHLVFSLFMLMQSELRLTQTAPWMLHLLTNDLRLTLWIQTLCKPCLWSSSALPTPPLDNAVDLILLGVQCNLCHCGFEEYHPWCSFCYKHPLYFSDSNKILSVATVFMLCLATGHTSKFAKYYVMLLTHDARGI